MRFATRLARPRRPAATLRRRLSLAAGALGLVACGDGEPPCDYGGDLTIETRDEPVVETAFTCSGGDVFLCGSIQEVGWGTIACGEDDSGEAELNRQMRFRVAADGGPTLTIRLRVDDSGEVALARAVLFDGDDKLRGGHGRDAERRDPR